MKTLLLDVELWDLVRDASGNIAIASDPYAPAQDAASAIRLFKGELYYDQSKGVPYWDRPVNPASRGVILGKAPPINYMRQKFVSAALTVPGVKSAKAFIASIKGRVVTGQVQIKTDFGQTSAVNF